MSDPLFGWDLTFKTVEKDIKKKSDVLIAFAHFNLIKRGFRCIGVGDDMQQPLSSEESSSELLPSEWNSGQQYSLRYTLNSKVYVLKGLLSDGSLVLNLMKVEDLAVSSLAFNVEETVKQTQGSIEKLIPEYKEVMHKLKRDVIDSICERSTSTTETQTREEPREERSSSILLERPRAPIAGPTFGWPEADPLRVGHSDLDPFSRGGGGGMIFDPFSNRPGGRIDPGIGIPGGLPRGAVPPGARFDPFGPPNAMPPRRQPPPDSDDFMPPGNYYM